MAEVSDTEQNGPYAALASSPRSIFSPQEYLDYVKKRQARPKILDLIERFYHQIRYGCTNTSCKTPACRSHREQKSKGVPYRVPTPTTARAFAAYLASLDDPISYLCTNIPAPKTDPFDIAFPASKTLYVECGVDGKAAIADSAELFAKAEIEEWMHLQALSGTPVDLQQPLPYRIDSPIDAKSFTQTLFSSYSWKMLLSSQGIGGRALPRHLSVDSTLSQADAPPSPVRDVLNELQNPKYANLVKSFLGTLSPNHTFIKWAYDGKDDPDIQAGSGNETFKDDHSDTEFEYADPNELLQILSNASMLMHCGLDPLTYQYLEGRLVSEIPAVRATVPGAALFQSKRSLHFGNLWCEMTLLLEWNVVFPNNLIQSLATSVKATRLGGRNTKSMPSPIAAHILCVAIAILSASVFRGSEEIEAWTIFQSFRQRGHVQYSGLQSTKSLPGANRYRETFDRWSLAYEEPGAQYLMKLILRSFASWSYFSTDIVSKTDLDSAGDNRILEMDCDFKTRIRMFLFGGQCLSKPREGLLLLVLLEWARTIFLRNWDGNYYFEWNTDLGASIEFMRWLHENAEKLSIQADAFQMPVLIERIDYIEGCRDWMNFTVSPSTGHLFDFPWLFPNEAKVIIFRSINLCRMFASFVTSVTNAELVKRLELSIKHPAQQLLDKLVISMNKILVLDIRRDNILRDAFDQLWRRQKRELFRPLRVRMGMDEGEEGVDMGGVQQEFFRLAIADALDPINGLFTVDERTRMTWFQPKSPAPLYQFTLIGLLFGLAVYNGITLSITFPLAFYRKLQGLRNHDLHSIKDGWPELHEGLQSLLTWSDGLVEDVFLRTYTFSFKSSGVVHDFDMMNVSNEKDDNIEDRSHTDTGDASNSESGSLVPEETSEQTIPSASDSTSSSEPVMVTNENRKAYVRDYIHWLTDKSIAPQFKAFADGFYLPLQKKSLHLFTAEELQSVLEGQESINIEELKETTQYEDGFHADHPKIKEFWEIVDDFSPSEHQKLLEFVTASTRVPVRGMVDVTFVIQRNGVGDERLPSSMTCFGRLLLPEYSSKKIMAEKLRLAIENSTGFGTQ